MEGSRITIKLDKELQDVSFGELKVGDFFLSSLGNLFIKTGKTDGLNLTQKAITQISDVIIVRVVDVDITVKRKDKNEQENKND